MSSDMANRKIDRRGALALFGAAGASAMVLGACAGSDEQNAESPTTTRSGSSGASDSATTTSSAADFENAASCGLTPEQSEGPYYIDVDKIRSDIREDREGVELKVAARVLDADGCTPIKDAVFEIWHCDAGGVYSGFGGNSARFLRGGQITNADGIAEITTVYPGWYQGRTAHIHAKVAISNAEVLTTQFYFDDTVSDEVYAKAPYNQHSGRRTLNRSDNIYDAKTTLTLSKDGDAYIGRINLGVQR